MAAKYGHLMLPGAFPYEATPDINVTDEVVVQFDAPVLKLLLQVMVI